MKKWIIGTIVGMTLASGSVWAEENRVFVDDIPVHYTDVHPYGDGNFYIPLRVTLEEAGARLQWNEVTRTVEIESKNKTTSLAVDSQGVIIKDGRTYIVRDVFGQKTGYPAVLNQDGTLNIESGLVTNVEAIPKDASVIVDVRTEEEFAQGHVEKALNIPVTKLEERLSELEAFKDKSLVVYCKAGTRSQSAVKLLRKHGFSKIVHLYKGYDSIKSK